jgi:transcription elongation factor Elf1
MMAKYTFTCPQCGKEEQRFANPKQISVPCSECGTPTDRQLPVLNGPVTVKEVIDKHRNTIWNQGHKEDIEERKQKYFWEVEVPRLVNSGTYSIQTMLEQGWISVNDKEQVIINTKPPAKR